MGAAVKSTIAIGAVNGQLTVIGMKGRLLRCRCACGTERDLYASKFKPNSVLSCGCSAHPKGVIDTAKLAAKMELFSIPEPNTGCTLWLKHLAPNGYGTVAVGGRVRYAHRVAFELAKGPIPSGLQIDHLCRVRSCINPQHLEAVTQKVNWFRGFSPPALNAKKTHCRRGHLLDSRHFVYGKARGRYCSTCNRDREYARTRLTGISL
jgi:hypothetical protein